LDSFGQPFAKSFPHFALSPRGRYHEQSSFMG
jgi:hypothetical protein